MRSTYWDLAFPINKFNRLSGLAYQLPDGRTITYLVDSQGTMVSFVINRDLVGEIDLPSSVAVGQAYADRPWFQAVARDERSAVTPLYESLMSGDQCFTVAAAVRDVDQRMIGMLGFDVNVRNWTRI